MKRILLVEDDVTLGQGICLALRETDTRITLCRTLGEARACAKTGDMNLMILDINLPDGTGLELLRELRESGNSVPVIMLTVNDMEMDVVNALENGADDYITKPFSLAILRARVHAQLRRERSSPDNRVVIGPYVFDFERMEYAKDGFQVELSKTEQKLLRVLVQNRGRTMSRAALVDEVWTGGAEYVDENALSVTVKRLRDKLEEQPSKPRYLKTVYGIGYTWAVN